MTKDDRYSQDLEFRKLLTRRSDIDLPVAALEIARDAYPGMEFGPTLAWMQNCADKLAGRISRSKSGFQILEAICECIAVEHGIFGNQESYESADSSFLNRIIETKRGIPIALSVLYMGVASKAGIELHGVAAPMHFLTRYESVDGPLFVDPFSPGRILNFEDCRQWVQSISGIDSEDIPVHLRAANPRSIIVRMLNNLKALHARHDEWDRALLIQQRLTALSPASYPERRDLALISVRAQRPQAALENLLRCLRDCPNDERETLETHLKEAQRQLSQWN